MITDDKLEEVNILLCEDDESLGMLLREYLEAKGYNTTLCQDGEEGFDTFLQGNFNLCIRTIILGNFNLIPIHGILIVSPRLSLNRTSAKPYKAEKDRKQNNYFQSYPAFYIFFLILVHVINTPLLYKYDML